MDSVGLLSPLGVVLDLCLRLSDSGIRRLLGNVLNSGINAKLLEEVRKLLVL